MTIEIIKYKPHQKGALLGFVDFYVPKMGLEIYGSSIYQKDGRKWVNLPTKEYKNKDGENKWSFVVRFREKEHSTAFSKAILEAVDRWILDNQDTNTQPEDSDDGVPF